MEETERRTKPKGAVFIPPTGFRITRNKREQVLHTLASQILMSVRAQDIWKECGLTGGEWEKLGFRGTLSCVVGRRHSAATAYTSGFMAAVSRFNSKKLRNGTARAFREEYQEAFVKAFRHMFSNIMLCPDTTSALAERCAIKHAQQTARAFGKGYLAACDGLFDEGKGGLISDAEMKELKDYVLGEPKGKPSEQTRTAAEGLPPRWK